MDPITWLCGVVDMLKLKHDGRFKVLSSDRNTADILHVESGAVWRFKARVMAKGVG